jgi:TonB-dependent starch-binding outer membrane protein SusC
MRRFSTKLSFLIVVTLFFSFSMVAQKAITGMITDAATGEALIGANILIKGTSNGTITDIDGTFSLNASVGDVLVISYTGYTGTELTVTEESTYNVQLGAGRFLDEVVVVGYGSQRQKELTSAVVSVGEKDFNKGPIASPAQLLQGKVAGLQIYNRGGNPNSQPTIRVRGLSTVGANVQPLIVIDGVIGASLQNIDPADIESMDVLKDGSAAAIYGSRGSSGVIIVTTKKGKQGFKMSYNGQLGGSVKARQLKIMTPTEFKAAGGTDLGAETFWVDEVTRTGRDMVHNISAEGGSGNTTYRVSGNYRNTDGIVVGSGFEQINTRARLSTKALNDKLSIDFNTSFTDRESEFGYPEALRYALMYNPTAPIFGSESKFPFNEEQFGGYFETLGLFDSFNPVSIAKQNTNNGKTKEFIYGTDLGYNFTNSFKMNLRYSQQSTSFARREYAPTTTLFRGNATSPTRKGRADFYNNETEFKLFETFGTYLATAGNTNLTFTGGYSFQQNNFRENSFGIGDFPNDTREFINNIGTAQDLQNAGLIGAGSYTGPDERIIAFFGRANANIGEGIFLNASIRREGATKLGADNRWGWFPSLGAGIDINKYAGLGNVDVLKLRVGYGVTGALPGPNGLSQDIRNIVNGSDGSVSTRLARAGNPNLKWEEKAELNAGIDFGFGKLTGSLDAFNRNIKDFILEIIVDATQFGVDRQFQNAGQLNARGLELALNYDVFNSGSSSYSTSLVMSTYSTVLKNYVQEQNVIGNLGSPGQNGTNMILIKEGQQVGQIWGPVYDGLGDGGTPKFKDLNGDGQIIAAQDQALNPNADFQVLGNGFPTFELGWNNNLSVGGFDINAFFRGAFGHSLVNSFRAFYEPQISTQSSYNFMNTRLKVDGLSTAQFSSLYVERADFFKLDNLSISRRIPLQSKAITNLNLSLTGNNLFVITKYTGSDPEPALFDTEGAGVLAPGIDRRANFFAPRVFALGVNFNF